MITRKTSAPFYLLLSHSYVYPYRDLRRRIIKETSPPTHPIYPLLSIKTPNPTNPNSSLNNNLKPTHQHHPLHTPLPIPPLKHHALPIDAQIPLAAPHPATRGPSLIVQLA